MLPSGTTTIPELPTFMLAVMLHLFIFYSLYNNGFIQYLISLDGKVDLKYISFIISFKRYITQKLEFIYQKRCVGNTKYIFSTMKERKIYYFLYVSFTI